MIRLLLRFSGMMPLLLASFGVAQESPRPVPAKVPDAQTLLSPGAIVLEGGLDARLRKGVEAHLKPIEYPRMVDFFRFRTNPFASGEFWGKTVRSACLSWQYREDAGLKSVLEKTVADLLSTQTPDGCISARTYPNQPGGSDLWERKYVLLGLLGYYELTRDPDVLAAMIRLADYTLAQVGPAPKTRIVDTGWAFEGIESSSILEPLLRLYRLTGFRRYLDFATYIVETEGACKRGSIFEAVLRGVPPKDVNSNGDPSQSIAKAYESMSCFEGLAEYYRVTGNPRWKQAVDTYYRGIRDQEITILGSGGGEGFYNAGPGTGEQWNNLALEQSHPHPRLLMETCVTVTWIKFCAQVLRLGGDPTVADQLETSIHNALLGAQKPSGDYYDYFQCFNGTRDTRVNFTADIGRFPLSCCTANGPMGMALAPFLHVMESADGPVINLYHGGTFRAACPGGPPVSLHVKTDYPRSGEVVIAVAPRSPQRFALSLRIPAWSARTDLRVNGNAVAAVPGTYARIDRLWSPGDEVRLSLDMRCRLVRAPRGRERCGDPYVAVARGPLVLARDLRLEADIDEPVAIQADAAGFVNAPSLTPSLPSLIEIEVPLKDGRAIRMIDYASAGNTWDAASEFRTWLRDAEAAPSAAASYVPPPQPAPAESCQVGVFICPLWKTGARDGREWESLLPFPKRQPVLGWYDEGDPQVTDWEIKYLLEHGITYGVVCWYREKDNANQPVKPWLGHWLHDGLFKSRYGNQFKFAILWENLSRRAEGHTSGQDLMNHLLPFWIDNYFRRDNYLRVSGKPLLMIYGVKRFVDDLGGETQAKAALERMRQHCRDQGLGGLVILGEDHLSPSDPLTLMSAIGLDGAASYHWPTFAGVFPGNADPGKIVAVQEQCWRERAKAALPSALTVSAGWDSRPWQARGPDGIRGWQLHPVLFKDLCRRARAFAEAQPASNPFGKMVLIDNWNEFGEGHYIFPHREFGFAHLNAVRSVFSPNAPPHRDLVPEEAGLGPSNRLFVEQRKQREMEPRPDAGERR